MAKKPVDKQFNVENDVQEISVAFLEELITTHKKKIAPKYRKYQKLYENKHKIQNRPRKDENKPNNKLANDFYGQIIDNTVGYFLGKPIVLNYTEPEKESKSVDPVDVGVDLTEIEDKAVQDAMDKILVDNEKDDIFMEWGKEMMIKGLSHILVYQNEESKTKFMRLSPEDVIIVYKNSSTKEAKWKIRLYDIDTEDTDTTTHYAEVYDDKGYSVYKCVEGGTAGNSTTGYKLEKRESHIYGMIPIVTVYNNEETMSDLERIESLVNDYDKVLSDVSNEFEAFRNAYLMLKNMIVGSEDAERLREQGIIEVMENGDAKFITKQIQTEALENHLNRLERNIYKFSQVPDLSDESFAGNLSGVAIRFKLFGLETKCIIKERKMTKAIRDLFRVISAPLRVLTGKDVDVMNLSIEWSRNVPNNITELVDTVTKLEGKVDKETLLALLPFIDNPSEVLKKLEADLQKEKANADPYSMQNVQADANNLFPNLNSPQEQLNAMGATIPQPQQ
jgi:SPP1 family phage portal protein